MALRPHRHVHQTTMDYILTQAAEPGTTLVASGVSTPTAAIADSSLLTVASGVSALGILLNTRESYNYAKETERFQYDTDDLNTVVSILREGEVETNLVVENAGSIVAGDPAYLAPDGKLGNSTLGASDAEARLRVGQFLSTVDSDGFVRVRVNLG
jgi:hypothetical protein